MTTKLDRPLKRELEIAGCVYTLTVSRGGFKLTQKGRRKGIDLEWSAVIAGDVVPSSDPGAASLSDTQVEAATME